MSSAFKIKTNGDLNVSTGGFAVEKRPSYAAVIRLRNKLLLFKGTWFLDLDQGQDYLSWLFVKSPKVALIRSKLQEIILSVDPIISMEMTRFEIDKRTRSFVYAFTAKCVDGSLITGSSNGDVFAVTTL